MGKSSRMGQKEVKVTTRNLMALSEKYVGMENAQFELTKIYQKQEIIVSFDRGFGVLGFWGFGD